MEDIPEDIPPKFCSRLLCSSGVKAARELFRVEQLLSVSVFRIRVLPQV
jgi:hypothetical protein